MNIIQRIEFTLRERGDGLGKIIAPLSIHQIEKDFAIDTGSKFTCVFHPEFQSGFQEVGDYEARSLNQVNQQGTFIQVDNIHQDSQWEHEQLKILRMNVPERKCQLLGMDVFIDQCFEFNFQKNQILFYDEFPQLDYYIPIELQHGYQLSMDCRIGKESRLFGIDTGADLSVIDEEFIKEHSEDFKLMNQVSTVDSFQNPIQLNIYKLRELNFHGHRFKNISIIGMNTKQTGSNQFILGYHIFKKLNWRFDLKSVNKKCWISPITS